MVTPPANILLVDDEPASLLALEAVLHDLGGLVSARSGEEGLHRLAGADFAVVLLDVHMAGLDGFETAVPIRSRERSGRTPIVFVTAHDVDCKLIEQADSLGAVDHVVRPLMPVVLRAKVTGFVELFQRPSRRAAEPNGCRTRHSRPDPSAGPAPG